MRTVSIVLADGSYCEAKTRATTLTGVLRALDVTVKHAFATPEGEVWTPDGDLVGLIYGYAAPGVTRETL